MQRKSVRRVLKTMKVMTMVMGQDRGAMDERWEGKPE